MSNEQTRTQAATLPLDNQWSYWFCWYFLIWYSKNCLQPSWNMQWANKDPGSHYFHLHARAPPAAVPGCEDKRILNSSECRHENYSKSVSCDYLCLSLSLLLYLPNHKTIELVKDCSSSIANALESMQPWIKPSDPQDFNMCCPCGSRMHFGGKK